MVCYLFTDNQIISELQQEKFACMWLFARGHSLVSMVGSGSWKSSRKPQTDWFEKSEEFEAAREAGKLQKEC